MLKTTLSESFTGIIWKILLDKEAGLIAIESRNAELRQVAFSVHNYQTGETLIKEKSVEEPWYSALAHIGNGHLFINGYEYAGSPVSKGIIALNINTETITWQHYNLSFYDAWEEGIRVYNPNISPRKFEWLDPATGKSISVKNPTAIHTDIQLPEPGKIELIPDLTERHTIIGEVLHLKFQEKNIVSFHEKIHDHLQLRLIVYQQDNLLLDIIIANHIQKLQPETFFVHQSHLFCIQNSNQIVLYKLV